VVPSCTEAWKLRLPTLPSVGLHSRVSDLDRAKGSYGALFSYLRDE
jgi:hypothetical protein